MPDPLTTDDLDAILRGGGSAEDKLQRAATMALEKRAMGKDLLTYDEYCELRRDYDDGKDLSTVLKAAARLGAERAMAAPHSDLPGMLASLDRLRDWYETGPAQRAELDALVAWVRDLERYGRRGEDATGKEALHVGGDNGR